MKKIFGLFVVVALALTSLTGCPGEKKPEDKKTEKKTEDKKPS